MYPGLPSRLEKELKQLYLTEILGGKPDRLSVCFSLASFRDDDDALRALEI